jgi:hypothetical protein
MVELESAEAAPAD